MADFKHKEAFCLMVYQCDGSHDTTQQYTPGMGRFPRTPGCGHREIFWNSRDGVTPFGMQCPSCGGDLYHVDWHLDLRMPEHKPHHGQGIWRDGTPDDAERIMRRRLEAYPPRDDAERERAEQMIARVKAGDSTEFRTGWPMFDRHGLVSHG